MEVIDQGHLYHVKNVESGHQAIQFIDKDPAKDGSGKYVTVRDGTTNEELLKVLLNRLTSLNDIMPSIYNENAIAHVEDALKALVRRTTDREARNVEGTINK